MQFETLLQQINVFNLNSQTFWIFSILQQYMNIIPHTYIVGLSKPTWHTQFVSGIMSKFVMMCLSIHQDGCKKILGHTWVTPTMIGDWNWISTAYHVMTKKNWSLNF
jgi:hypothetical protein